MCFFNTVQFDKYFIHPQITMAEGLQIPPIGKGRRGREAIVRQLTRQLKQNATTPTKTPNLTWAKGWTQTPLEGNEKHNITKVT